MEINNDIIGKIQKMQLIRYDPAIRMDSVR